MTGSSSATSSICRPRCDASASITDLRTRGSGSPRARTRLPAMRAEVPNCPSAVAAALRCVTVPLLSRSETTVTGGSGSLARAVAAASPASASARPTSRAGAAPREGTGRPQCLEQAGERPRSGPESLGGRLGDVLVPIGQRPDKRLDGTGVVHPAEGHDRRQAHVRPHPLLSQASERRYGARITEFAQGTGGRGELGIGPHPVPPLKDPG